MIIWKLTARRNCSEPPPERQAAGRCASASERTTQLTMKSKEMKDMRIIFLTITFLILNCSTNAANQTTVEADSVFRSRTDSVFSNRLNFILSNLGDLRLNDVKSKEQEWDGVDNMPDYRLGIGESYYPNPNKYEIDTFRVYLIHEDSLIENSITYYATKESGLIRVVFLEWEEPFLINPSLQEKADETFRNKSMLLEYSIIYELGTKIWRREDNEMQNYKTILWKTFDDFTINLEIMKPFNRIRIIIYKDYT